MGATVTTGRRASAFRAQDGRIIYVLYEETYEKYCYPHTPHWSVIGLGKLEDVLQRIFAYGSSCGMLQNRSGWISPEGYVRSWLKELQSPIEQHDGTPKMELSSRFSTTLSSDKTEMVAAALAAIGNAALFERIGRGRFDRGDGEVARAEYPRVSPEVPSHRNGNRLRNCSDDGMPLRLHLPTENPDALDLRSCLRATLDIGSTN